MYVPYFLLGSIEKSSGSKDEIVNTDDLLDLNIETEVIPKLDPAPKTLQDTGMKNDNNDTSNFDTGRHMASKNAENGKKFGSS